MESERKLHIVSFDNPWPPDYGGASDVYYRIRQLARENISITLHLFEYGRKNPGDLADYCNKICFYKRKTLVNPISALPYIVASRTSPELLTNLLADNAPVLFEGIHTCHLLSHPALAGRIKLVRMHNIEHRYYRSLAANEHSALRSLWFILESCKLKNYSKVLVHANSVLAISRADREEIANINPETYVAGPFHQSETPVSLTGRGSFALYHGKLSVAENDRAARFLAEEVAPISPLPLIIAGSNPGPLLRRTISKSKNTSLVENPGMAGLENLIAGAHIHLLPAFQNTGVKIKLVNALFRGRFIVANSMMVEETGCESLCHIAGTPEDYARIINDLALRDFTRNEIETRRQILGELFCNKTNAGIIIEKAGL